MAVTQKQIVAKLADRCAALEARMARSEADALVLKTRVECYEKMLDAVFRGLAAAAQPHPFQQPFTWPPVTSQNAAPAAGGGS